MFSCTLLGNLFKLVTWSKSNEDSPAALSHFLNASREIGWEAGGVDVRLDDFASLL